MINPTKHIGSVLITLMILIMGTGLTFAAETGKETGSVTEGAAPVDAHTPAVVKFAGLPTHHSYF